MSSSVFDIVLYQYKMFRQEDASNVVRRQQDT